MIVIALQSGEPYVFPPYAQMQADILAMQNNTGLANVGKFLQSLQGIAQSGGSAEIQRLQYLNGIIAARLTAAQAAAPITSPSLATANANLTASVANLKPINQFLAANQGSVGSIETSAAGKQALDTLRDIEESDRSVADRATFMDSRARFWVAELQLAQKWIAARQAYLSSQYGVA